MKSSMCGEKRHFIVSFVSFNHLVYMLDSFLSGHCHAFALALNSVFNYKLGLIKGKTIDSNGEERQHLFHAFGVDSIGQGFDIRGLYNYEEALVEYKTREHPGNKMVPFDVELLILEKESFIQEVLKFGIDESFIENGILEIKTRPHKFFRQSNIVSEKIFQVVTNENYKVNGDLFYNLKHDEDWSEQISKLVKGKTVTPFKTISFRFKHSGFLIGLGFDDYELEINDMVFKVENNIQDITDEESLLNLKKLYFVEIPSYIKE